MFCIIIYTEFLKSFLIYNNKNGLGFPKADTFMVFAFFYYIKMGVENVQIIDKQIKDLKPYENNPRKNDEAVKYVAESIKQFGFKVPIIIDKDNIIITGHTRYKAAKQLKIEVVPCIIADDLTEEQIKAFRLADNKVAEFAEWDFNILNAELEEIMNFDMSSFGFEIEDIEDNFGTDFELPNEDKNELEQITFTLHTEQAELIKYALEQVKNDITETFGNTNKNGNAIYEVVRQWAELKK